MSYKDRINRVVDYIGSHLDEDLKLESLCRIACFSKYHFHRLFTAHTGVSLSSYIKWLRLKRSAYQLTMQKDDTIINIALDAGFESHEAYTRAFKKACGQSPSEFRKSADWSMWRNPTSPLLNKGETIMTTIIRDLSPRRLAVMEHHGDPMTLSSTLDRLMSWAAAQPIDVMPKPGEAFGFAYDDPRDSAAEEWQFDFALTVPDHFKLSGDVSEKVLPGGRYAVTTHKGSRDNIGDTVYGIYRDWLPASGEEPGDLPCIFCYQNFDNETAETELLTEIWVLLK